MKTFEEIKEFLKAYAQAVKIPQIKEEEEWLLFGNYVVHMSAASAIEYIWRRQTILVVPSAEAWTRGGEELYLLSEVVGSWPAEKPRVLSEEM